VRDRRTVRLRTLAYLGPLSLVAAGVPNAKKKELEARLKTKIDWLKVAEEVRGVRLSFSELEEMRSRNFAKVSRARAAGARKARRRTARDTGPLDLDSLFAERESGELVALAKLSRLAFRKRFEQIGERRYRLRG
jgi:hypothetical protein